MESSDEDDKFLYGSDVEEATKDAKSENINDKKRTSDVAEVNISRSDTKRTKIDNSESLIDKQNKVDNSNDTDEIADYSDDENEIDVEFIVSLGPDPSILDYKSIANSGTTTADVISVATDNKSESTTENTSEPISNNKPRNQVDGNGQPVDMVGINASSIDLDKDGLYDGQPITDIDPEVLKEKPWRQPGANMSDYFNYGFNEYTWIEYLHRQERLKQEYNPRNILMGLLTLQQQGKLDIKSHKDMSKSSTQQNIPNNKPVPNIPQNITNQRNQQTIPPGFPPMPMFGGFNPFQMPGMIPMNRQMNPNQNNQPNQMNKK